MNVKIINLCKKFYRPHPEKIIARILEKIPEKFLIGLAEVRLFDSKPSKTVKKSWICQTIPSQHSIIEIYMDDPLLTGIPFFSLLYLNTVFLGAITEHIRNYLQPGSTDEEILVYKSPWNLNIKWGYWGIWTPVIAILGIGSFLTSQFSIFRKIWLRLANRFIEKHQ